MYAFTLCRLLVSRQYAEMQMLQKSGLGDLTMIYAKDVDAKRWGKSSWVDANIEMDQPNLDGLQIEYENRL